MKRRSLGRPLAFVFKQWSKRRSITLMVVGVGSHGLWVLTWTVGRESASHFS